jgi:hypothetical protein
MSEQGDEGTDWPPRSRRSGRRRGGQEKKRGLAGAVAIMVAPSAIKVGEPAERDSGLA